MIITFIFLAVSVLLIIITNASDFALQLPNPLIIKIFTKTGESNLFYFLGITISSIECFLVVIYKCINDFYSKKILSLEKSSFLLIGIASGSIIKQIDSIVVFADIPLLICLGATIFYISLFELVYSFKKSPLGIKKLYYVFYAVIIGYCSFYLLKKDLTLTSPLSDFFSSILFIVMLSTWPNKPFALKNVFNELSGENELRRNNLVQNK